MSSENYVAQQYCFDEHKKVQEELHQLETNLTECINKLDKDLSTRMTKLETHFNDALDDKVRSAQMRTAVISAALGGGLSLLVIVVKALIGV